MVGMGSHRATHRSQIQVLRAQRVPAQAQAQAKTKAKAQAQARAQAQAKQTQGFADDGHRQHPRGGNANNTAG
jgi:hypothetical protein